MFLGFSCLYRHPPRPPVPEAGSAKRYLLYDQDPCHKSGLLHQLRNLQWLMREAHSVGRLAIVPPLRLSRRHNFGVMRDWCWDDYFDLNASRLVDTTGREHPLPLARELPDRVFDASILRPRMRVPASAADRELVVRRVRCSLFQRSLPIGLLARLLGDVAVGSPAITFRMQPSARVASLAAPVIEALRLRGRYAAVHVRRGDLLEHVGALLEQRTSPVYIRRRLRTLGVPDGAMVFFLSDETGAAFWPALARHYEVVRYTDFQHLDSLVPHDTGEDASVDNVDNHLLYATEMAVMRAADLRVETLPGPNYVPAHGTLVSRRAWLAHRAWRRIHALGGGVIR